MDKEHIEDLLEDLQSLTELHEQFMSTAEYIAELMVYCTHLSLRCSPTLAEALELLNKSISIGLETYERALNDSIIED